MAIIAFGMGIDIPDVRKVIYIGPPNDVLKDTCKKQVMEDVMV